MICPDCNQEFTPTRANQRRHPACRRKKRNRGKNKHNARARRNADHLVNFIGVDGEGVTMGGAHNYVLLTCGDQSLHMDGDRLTTHDIFEFLWSCFLDNPDAAFVGYYLKYDFAQWFRDLPVSRARAMLLEVARRRRTARPNLPPYPVDWGDWQIDINEQGSRFRLRKMPPNMGWSQRKGYKGPWMWICDVGAFFQCSFLKAIDPKNWRVPIVTAREFASVKKGKEGRGHDEFSSDMIKYNMLECEILARLMRDQNEGLTAEGVWLRKTQWTGPGQVAQAWLSTIEAPQGELVRETAPDWFRDAARSSYFGGWFEIFWHGLYEGIAHGYDINSAYPDIMSRLPCLLHGVYSRGRIMRGHALARMRKTSLVLVEATVEGSHSLVGGMLHRRSDHSVLRPRRTEGWFWLHELEAAQRAGFVDMFHVKQWCSYEPCDCPPPLAAISSLYETRLAVGKNSAAGKAKKLIYNSAYGKFAQSVGLPTFANPIYASLITCGCRTRILEAIASHPSGASSLLMVATDGVVFGEPHDALDFDNARLGAWAQGEHKNLSLFMPGVYWDDATRADIAAGLTLKSRGISARDLSKRISVIDRAWSRYRSDGWPRLRIPVGFQLVSPRQALARGKWELCGSVVTDGERIVSADPSPKRVGRGPGRSSPYGECSELRSHPYDGTFGEELREGAESEFGDHPDGPVGAVLMRELMGH
jgi:DNA polymerase type B, organellar and viral